MVPELVWSNFSTPTGTEHEAFFNPPSRRSAHKLRKLAHPPPSFHAFSTALAANRTELSFQVDEPPPTEQSNFPFIFPEPTGRRPASSDYARTFRSQSDSGHTYARPPSIISSSSRPLTSLSMADSRTPLLRSLSALGIRKAIDTPAPTRKLTKRKPSVVNQFKPLPVPEPQFLSIPPPSKSLEQISDAPKRRLSITFAFTVALKRRLSMPKGKAKQEQQEQQEELPKTPYKSRSTSHVHTLTAPSSLTPSSSTKSKRTATDKHLPEPPPTPPAKDPTSSLSPSRTSLPSTPLSASTTSSKLRKERIKKKKFSIGADIDDVVDVPPVPPHLSSPNTHPSGPSPNKVVEQVFDLSLDRDSHIALVPPSSYKDLPSIPRSSHPPENTTPSSSSSVEARTQRRWTLALAMTSEDLTDEVFVERVERLRRDSIRVTVEHETPDSKTRSVEGVGGFKGWEFGYLDPDSDYDWDGEDERYDESFEDIYHGAENSMPNLPRSISTHSVSVKMGLPRSVSSVSNSSNADPAKAWSSALHAMLITRDLLRTEKNYLNQLKVLLSSSPCVMTPAAQAVAETSFLWGIPGDSLLSSSGVASTTGLLNLATVDSGKLNSTSLPWPKYPPPSLMHTYLLSLIALSLCLLSEWEKDPTIVGAGRVLVEKEEEIERVFVGWCGVVGGWFARNDDGSGKKAKWSLEETESRRSRKLSKPRFSPATLSSLSTLTTPSISATVSTASMLSLTHSTTVLPPSLTGITVENRTHVTRSSTMSTAMAKWRKSMPNVQALADLTTNTEHADKNLASASYVPKSAEPRVGSFDQSYSQKRSLPISTYDSKGSVSVRRASTFLSLTNFEKDQSEVGYRGRGREREKENHSSLFERSQVPPRSRSHGVLPRVNWSEKSKSSLGFGVGKQPDSSGLIDARGRKIHSVCELGILPVQRVTRYALLFRDLLKYTPPTSPSRPLLEQASEAAARIAAKCDRAQGNAEFFFGVSTSEKVMR
ncbi:hypothetical protein J3R30DRAFT_3730909 [Lentinula aciculospora]|uniref:DH domain-containing protein n=1 Tax=Lentinula aciculospora TaxID=153920 RepID=A0A9W9APC7_9AGAR|nr:hypothetical protein J3R30DRAFT_3730909 [Lentinula aciculospora]